VPRERECVVHGHGRSPRLVLHARPGVELLPNDLTQLLGSGHDWWWGVSFRCQQHPYSSRQGSDSLRPERECQRDGEHPTQQYGGEPPHVPMNR
jgi:hypothetical protein